MIQDEKQALLDWLRTIAEFLREMFAWLKAVPEKIGAEVSELTFEVRVAFAVFVGLILVHAFVTRRK